MGFISWSSLHHSLHFHFVFLSVLFWLAYLRVSQIVVCECESAELSLMSPWLPKCSVPYGPVIQRVIMTLWIFGGSVCNFRGSQENFTTAAKTCYNVGEPVIMCVCVYYNKNCSKFTMILVVCVCVCVCVCERERERERESFSVCF